MIFKRPFSLLTIDVVDYALISWIVSVICGQNLMAPPSFFRMVFQGNISVDDLAEYSAFTCGKKALCDKSKTTNNCPIEGLTCSSCSCDESCFTYNACCLDAYRHRGEVPEGNKYARCLSHEFKQSQAVDIAKYVMIARCPENETNHGDIFCERPDEDIFDHYLPVQSVISGQELTFRNRHCARCHGVADANMTSWIKERRCSGLIDYSRIRSISDYYKFTNESDQCAIFATPYDGAQVVKCDNDLGNTSIISTCPKGIPEQIKWLCEVLFHPIKERLPDYSYRWYKNEICLYCNRMPTRLANQRCAQPHKTLFAAPLSVLFDFNKPSKPVVVEVNEVIRCSWDMVYDVHAKTCRLIYCPVGMVIRNHTCYDLVPSAFGVGYRSAYTVVPTKRIKIPITYSKSMFAENYQRSVNKILGTLEYASCSQKILSSFTRGGFYIRMNNLTVYTKVIIGDHNPREIVERALLDIQNTNYYWYLSNDADRMENSSRRPLLLDDASERPFSNWTNSIENNDTELVVLNFYYMQFNKRVPRMYYASDKYFRIVNYLLSCPMILLNQSEYVFLQDDSILVNATKAVYKPGQYRLKEKNVYICTSFKGFHEVSRNKTIGNSRELDYEEVILTIVCISLSLLGLAITLITYAILPSLRTFPGLNNMALFSTMFVAQLLFITTIRANVSQTTCSALGALNHYFYLALFFWKSVCAFHMYRVFCRPLTHISKRKWLSIYSLYSFISPLIIVGVYILVNLAISDWSAIGYGGYVCFLSEPLGIALGFALPVALIIFVNIIFFFNVIHALKKSKEKMSDATSRANVTHTAVYFKMSLLLGFTWLVGFLASGTGSKVLWYLFSFLNSIIGVFVCMAYVFKRDVLSRLWHRVNPTTGRVYSDSTKTTNASSKESRSRDTSDVTTL